MPGDDHRSQQVEAPGSTVLMVRWHHGRDGRQQNDADWDVDPAPAGTGGEDSGNDPATTPRPPMEAHTPRPCWFLAVEAGDEGRLTAFDLRPNGSLAHSARHRPGSTGPL
jgi:hypothetical protein